MDEAVKKLKELPGYSDSDKATKERVQAAIDKMPVKSDRENAGLSETEMILFNAALGMVDEPTKKTETSEGGKYGTYTNDEVKKAIEMGDYTREQKAYLWDAAGKNEKTNPYR